MTTRTKVSAAIASVVVLLGGGFAAFEAETSSKPPASQPHRYTDYLDDGGEPSDCPSAAATPTPGGWMCPTPPQPGPSSTVRR